MSQMTLRTSDDLMRRVRAAAQREGRSLNDYVTSVLDAATDPDLAGSEAERIRERLAAAGLLAPPGASRRRPPARSLDAARRAAGKGRPLSEIVSDGRG
jgi:hypothetical protein